MATPDFLSPKREPYPIVTVPCPATPTSAGSITAGVAEMLRTGVPAPAVVFEQPPIFTRIPAGLPGHDGDRG